MTLHVFNPEHDIALASGLSNFTAPHAGRQLRHDLAFLPFLWADEGDAVLVADGRQARLAAGRCKSALSRFVSHDVRLPHIAFVDQKDLSTVGTIEKIAPWGWDNALRRELERRQVNAGLLPSEEHLETIRQLSHRRLTLQLLPSLRKSYTVGEAFECHSVSDVEQLLPGYARLVLKAPWSSSGRGLRFIDSYEGLTPSQEGWLRNMLLHQGCVLAEPYYNKVKDFGMEFHSDGNGRVKYLGLSLFHTQNGAYTGNVVASESYKQQMLGTYLPEEWLTETCHRLEQQLGILLDGHYEGPLGVDMMVVSRPDRKGFLLHPCVEVNLRRTMGHAALSLTPAHEQVAMVMRITLTDKYRLRFTRL